MSTEMGLKNKGIKIWRYEVCVRYYAVGNKM